jgi:uncharacterized protein (TIRG00374 family)
MEKAKLLPLVGILIFAGVLLFSGPERIASTLSRANPLILMAVILVDIPVVLLKAAKWKVIARAFRDSGPFLTYVKAWLVGFSIGIVTPGRVGEFTKAYYLKDRMGLGNGLSTIFVDRVLDITVLFMLAMLGAISLASAFAGVLGAEFILTVAALFAGFVVAVYLGATRMGIVGRLARPFFARAVPKRHRKGLQAAFSEFYKGLGTIRKRRRLVLYSAGLSVGAWLLGIVQYKLLSMALGLEIGYFFLLSMMPVVILLDTLPISFSGLGTRELAMIFFLSLVGITVEATVSYSIMIFLFGYLIFIPPALLIWFREPIRL